MILEDFYTLKSISEQEPGNFLAQISLNRNHEIFKGHFPGNPVTPGVCMMQIIKDLTENILQQKLFLNSASNVKFMAIINPEENPDLDIELLISQNGDEVKVRNTSSFGGTIALKMSVNYKLI